METGTLDDAGLLERDDALAAIDGLVSGVRASAGGLLVVQGVAGLGKSRLLELAIERAHGHGVAVRSVRGDYLERTYAWRAAADLLGAVPDAGREGEEAALELLRMFTLRVSRLTEEASLLLVLDDAHWLDTPTLRLIHFLGGRLDGLGAGILLAHRPREADAEDELLLQTIAAHPAARVVALKSLGTTSVERLVRADLGERTSSDFCNRCVELTGGNPYYLNELLRSLPGGSSPTTEMLEGIAPPTLARSVLIRLSRLGDEGVAVAEALAVLGDNAKAHHVAALASLAPAAALRQADALEAADLIRVDRGMRFAHPLIRAVVEDDMAAGARQSAHAQAASLQLAERAPVETVASHLLRAAVGAVPGAVATLRAAASRAVARGAPASAVVYLERAIEEPESLGERAAMRTELAEAAVAAGAASAVEHLEQALLDAPDDRARVRTYLALGWALHAAARFREAAEAFDAGMAIAPADEQLATMELRTGVMTAGMLDAGRAAETHSRLQSLHEMPYPTDAAERHFQSQLLVLGLFSGATPADDLAALASRLLDELGPGVDRIHDWTRWNAIGTLSWCDRYEEVLARLDPLLTGEATLSVAMASYARSWPSLWTGRIAQAAEDAQRAVDLWTAGAETYLPAAAYWLVTALCEQGHVDRAAAVLDGIDVGRWVDTAFYVFILAAQGRIADARGDARAAFGHWCASGRYFKDVMQATNPALMPWRSEAAMLATRLQERDTARELAEEDLAIARPFGAPRPIGSALRALGAATGGREGVALLEEAVAVLESSGAVLEHAHALGDLGSMLRRSGSRAQARAPLRDALAIARSCGGVALARRAEAELLASGARDAAPATRDDLTPSERRIAELAAQGLTNRQIAAQLYVTVKAVEFHLSRVFSKLDIRSRRELPRVLTGKAS
jgi:DNA-binding CsgD family transcriptional regulator